jgi:murein tripeptide amidase MpaA
VDFWKAGAAGKLSRVVIPPHLQNSFENFMIVNEIDYKVHIEDVGEVEKEFEADRVRRLKMKKLKSSVDPAAGPDFDVYWTTDEMDIFCRRLAINYPQFVTREVITRSFEGRDVYALKISSGGFGRKPIIFMDGGMHAREWVSQATVMYLLHRMIEDPASRTELLAGVDWIIVPNLNPDGYHWSYTQDRMWRKNRNEINSTCLGVDLNRNFRYSWTPPRILTVR